VWNEAMGEAALIGIVFSVFTLLLVFISFDQQRRALVQSREVTKAELRPYLFVDKVESEQRGERTFKVTV
jgi:hypothetical protein